MSAYSKGVFGKEHHRGEVLFLWSIDMRNADEIKKRMAYLSREMVSPETIGRTMSRSFGFHLGKCALEWVLSGDFKVDNIGTDEVMAFEMHDGRNLVIRSTNVWAKNEVNLVYEILNHPCSLCHINEAEDGHVCQRCKAIGGS